MPRIIAGSARSLRLTTVEGVQTRPTTDRIKETLFNILQNRIGGTRFLDLFSGSGSIGLEALSRGADEAVFVESGRKQAECIKHNISVTRMEARCRLMNSDVLSAIAALDREGRPFDFIYMDPPYGSDYYRSVFLALRDTSLVSAETTIIAEADIFHDFSFLEGDGYEVTRVKEYKTNKHVFASRSFGGSGTSASLVEGMEEDGNIDLRDVSGTPASPIEGRSEAIFTCTEGEEPVSIITNAPNLRNPGKSQRVGVYPGSFDPITYGHLDVIERASRLFDRLIVGVLFNRSKKSLFSADDRVKMICGVTSHLTNVEVVSFEGLSIDFARSYGANVLVRGLRAVTDFEYELQMAQTNHAMCPDIDTIFLTTDLRYSYLSSSIVREVSAFGGDVSMFVPESIIPYLNEKLSPKKQGFGGDTR
jgi:pantetheine-phosphate adenylyltransferase